MQKLFQNKVAIIILSVIGLIALAGLAGGIGEMSFRAPDGFALSFSFQEIFSFRPVNNSGADVPFWKVIVFTGAIAALLIIGVALLPPKLRKRLIQSIIRTTIFMICLFLAFRLEGKNLLSLFAGFTKAGQGQTGLNGTNPSDLKFIAPAQTPLAGYIASLIVIAVIILLVWLAVRMKSRTGGDVRRDISEIARETILEISDGGEWGDSITRCYVRMTNAINSARGIKRHRAMTPSEFSAHLSKAGLPGEPIQRLTRLFERVRYGEKRPTIQEQQEAIFCLNDIIRNCGGEA